MNKPLTKKEWEQSVASAWSTAVEATYKDMIAKAVEAEREACAKVCEAIAGDRHLSEAQKCVNAIRARGQA